MNILDKTYEPQKYEDAIYQRWKASDFFNPDTCIEKGMTKKDAKPFSLLMPPPNVTGVLHLGHALENALMDTTARFQRMRGKQTLYLPGTDHAAIATQARVEKMLIEEEGIAHPREELGREELLLRIRKYADSSKKTIQKQIRAMGSSCDWSRFAYTFDEDREKAVNTVFKKMYDDGLIYRGYRTVNWSVKGQSTCSDDEIEYVERSAKLYTFRYAKDFPIPIATTRPETKLGDTAVAVHPKHPKYAHYIGQQFTVDVGARDPLAIHVIADDSVDPDFGTGAVGVTPAHSQIDYDMYERHPEIGLRQVIGQDGRMTPEAGKEYAGLSTEAARKKFVAWLKKNNLLEKEEDVTQNVGVSDRFKDVVEVLPLKQWFIAVNKPIPGRNKTLKDLMREAVTKGIEDDPKRKIAIQPERFTKIYLHWIDTLRDWCISRQIWWGHRIPVWYQGEEMYCDTRPPEGSGWEQDSDTLDTWFSSGLWSFSTLGWPHFTETASQGKPGPENDFANYHPTSWMQMGRDILFFWMARMVLMTTYTLNTIPFRHVYFHGMLKNKDGQKFSKSLGTGIDPLDMKKKYGTDALRLSLLSDTTPGNDPCFYDEKIENARNLVNKLWNIARYVETQSKPQKKAFTLEQEKSDADTWIVGQVHAVAKSTTELLENYEFSIALDILRDFMWNEFADWYVEIHKQERNDAILRYVFETLLKLWHPFMPFVTEAIWQEMGRGKDDADLLMVAPWPRPPKSLGKRKHSPGDFPLVIETIKAIRNLRNEYGIEVSKKIPLIISIPAQDDETRDIFERAREIIMRLKTGVESLVVEENFSPREPYLSHVVQGNISIFIPQKSALDREKERARLTKEDENLATYETSLKRTLSNKSYIQNAPDHIVEQSRKKLEETQKKREEIQRSLKALS